MRKAVLGIVLISVAALALSAGFTDDPPARQTRRSTTKTGTTATKTDQRTRATSTSPSTPVGFFHFGAHSQLNRDFVGPVYVRCALEWDEFEPRRGVFVWGRENKQARIIDDLLAEGRKVIPSIRAKSAWAVRETRGVKCASAPRDLDLRKPLQVGQIYSGTYYNFVSQIARRYQGAFEIVVIENEMNDPDFWEASTDEYLRLFLTAQRALRDVDPNVKVTDGGIQGAALNWMVVSRYLEQRDSSAAVAFYERFTGESLPARNLMRQADKWQSKEPIRRAEELYASPLFDWCDLVNFHYYQQPDALPEVVALLRERAPTKPLMTNEVGIKERFAGDVHGASKMMVQKYARLLSLGVSPVIWFTPDGKKGNNGGALTDDNGKIILENKNSFEAISRFLGKPAEARHDLSTSELTHLRFGYGDHHVDVVWPRQASRTLPIQLEEGAEVYNYQNQRLNAASIPASAAPVFVISPAR